MENTRDLFKKIRDTKGTFHAKMGTLKDRNDMDLTEVEDIKIRTSLVAQTVKCLPTMRETWVQFLGREGPLEKEMSTHSSILAWKIPWTEELGRLQSMGHKESDTTEWLHFHFLSLFKTLRTKPGRPTS